LSTFDYEDSPTSTTGVLVTIDSYWVGSSSF